MVKTQLGFAVSLALLTAFAPCAVQAATSTTEQSTHQSCADSDTSFGGATQIDCLVLARTNGHRYYSYNCWESWANNCQCVSTASCDAVDIVDHAITGATKWVIKLMDCSATDGTALSTCDDSTLSALQKEACKGSAASGGNANYAASTSYPCACGSAVCATGEACTSSSNTCEKVCYPTAPTNGDLGDCDATLVSGATCQPTCDSGYSPSGSTSCTAGSLTSATCEANPCDTKAPTNGALGNCPASLASGATCQPTCDSGYTVSGSYTVSGTSSCSAGVFTVATCDTCCCPVYRRIDNEDECRAAIDALGHSGYEEYVNSDSDSWTYDNWMLLIPPGCSYSTGTEPGMHFEGVSGQAYSGFEPVCKLCTSFAEESTCKQASCAWSASTCVECATFTESDCVLDQCTWSSDSNVCQPAYVITTGSLVNKQKSPCETVGLTRLGSMDECETAGGVLGLVDENGAEISRITSSSIVQNGCIWKTKELNNLKWEESCDDQKATEDYASICKVSGAYLEGGTCSYESETEVAELYLDVKAVAQAQDTSAWAGTTMMIWLGAPSLLGIIVFGRWMRRRATSSEINDGSATEADDGSATEADEALLA